MLKIKKIFKLCVLFLILGVCVCYTYQFMTYHMKSDSKNEVVDKDSERKNTQNFDVGWERVRYSFFPSIEELTWVEVNSDYILGVESVSYRVTNASIQKTWDSKWNFEVVKAEYDFEDDKSLKGKKSFVSVSVELKNMGESACQCTLNCIALHIYDENGEKIISSEPATASLDKPNAKNYYFETLQSKETLKADIVYIVQDEYLKDEYYYFVDVIPWGAYPKSKDEIGIFKLPLGVERKSHDKK